MSTDGLDFSDGSLGDNDMKFDADPSQSEHLQRNKTERRRLQGLQRFNSAVPVTTKAYQPKSFREKWDRWMINEGGKRLFFFSWIFLHLLVAIFGFLNYQLKDNLTTARATFGITFGASFLV
jgi:NADPH oxidase 2